MAELVTYNRLIHVQIVVPRPTWMGRIVAIAVGCKPTLPRIPSEVRVLSQPPTPWYPNWQRKQVESLFSEGSNPSQGTIMTYPHLPQHWQRDLAQNQAVLSSNLRVGTNKRSLVQLAGDNRLKIYTVWVRVPGERPFLGVGRSDYALDSDSSKRGSIPLLPAIQRRCRIMDNSSDSHSEDPSSILGSVTIQGANLSEVQ